MQKLLVACVLACICIPAIAQTSSAVRSSAYLKTGVVAGKRSRVAVNNGVFSGTVAVLADGKIVYAKAFGAIGAGRSNRPDVHTQFNAGLISKVLTAVAMLQLRDERIVTDAFQGELVRHGHILG